MFDKLVISSSAAKDRRLSKFFLGSAALYLSALAMALVLTIVLANPQLVGATGGPSIHLIAANPQSAVQPAFPSSRSKPQPRLDFRNPVSITNVGSGQNTDTMFQRQPPLIGPVGPAPIGNGISDDSQNLTGTPIGVHVGTAPPPRPKPEPSPTPTPARTIRISGKVLQGKATSRAIPPYPVLAKIAHREGKVLVEVVVSPQGRVESARAVSGDPLLVKAAVQAAYNWRFEPTTLGGTPVSVTGAITFDFKLEQ